MHCFNPMEAVGLVFQKFQFNIMNPYFFLLFLCLLSLQTMAQAPSTLSAQEIDRLFEQYTSGNSPGYALGIVENGALIYSKGYGMANLDYDIPLTDTSAFYIGSMAKQFTAAALLILESSGKIDFSKPVRHYLPDFPEFEKEITIEHLLHHTSGIRETNSLQLFQGIDAQFEQPFDTDDLYQLIIDQKSLNFQPGEEFRYSSGGYAVLAKLIESISKQPLRNFMETHIFQPLGMRHTFVCDNHNEIIKNRVVSYWPVNNGTYERRSQVFDAYGDGGIITTVKDLAKWDQAFYSGLPGIKDFASKMYQKGRLNNGQEIEYARALQVRTYKGHQMVTHNGGMLGFRVDMVRFPGLNTSFILLGNSAYLDPTGTILKLADIYLAKDLKYTHPTPELALEAPYSIPSKALAAFTGHYWTDEMNYFRNISIRNDSLFLDSGNPDYGLYLYPISPNIFTIPGYYIDNHLHFQPAVDEKALIANFGGTRRTFRKFDPAPPENLDELKAYAGHYYSAELLTNYLLVIKAEKLFLQINHNKPFQIYPVPSDRNVVWNGKKMVWIGFGEIKFTFDDKGKTNGLIIGDGRVSGVKFEKRP